MSEPFRFTCPEGHPSWVPLTEDHREYADTFGLYCRTCGESYEVDLITEVHTDA